MDKFNTETVRLFRTMENVRYLFAILNKMFDSPSVSAYLKRTHKSNIVNFISALERDELMYSYPERTVHGKTTLRDIQAQLACANSTFIEHYSAFINAEILENDTSEDGNAQYQVEYNDGLNASTRTSISYMPQSVLSDTDTQWIDTPTLKSLNPSIDSQHLAIQNKSTANRSGLTGDSRTAEEILQQWRYPTRGANVRDDVVGDIVRDRNAPAVRNQNDYPYGNTRDIGGSGFPRRDTVRTPSRGSVYKSRSNGREIKLDPGEQEFPARQEGFTTYSRGEPGQPAPFRFDDNADGRTLNRGNDGSLCSARIATNTITNTFHDNLTNSGANSPVDSRNPSEEHAHNYSAVDQLLNNDYVQSLNDPNYGKKTPQRVQSTYDYQKNRGSRSVSADSAKITHRPQSSVKLWSTGSGFADETNEEEMKALFNRRIFRSHAPGKTGERGLTSTGDSAYEQIPYWQRAVHKRNYEYDVNENIGGFERDFINRGYRKDMESLKCRIPQKRPCGNRLNTHSR